MWILLKLKGLRFNKDEFLLITHSSFGHIPISDKKSLRIKYAYFKGENKVYNKEENIEIYRRYIADISCIGRGRHDISWRKIGDEIFL